MTKRLCYPVIQQGAVHIAIQTDDGTLVRSHTLNFRECRNMVDKMIEAMQTMYAEDKCKCD